jgi:hypothetical protein
MANNAFHPTPRTARLKAGVSAALRASLTAPLNSAVLHCVQGFRRVKGYASIPAVIEQIEALEASDPSLSRAA